MTGPDTYFVSEKEGDDIKGNGTKEFPFKSVRQVFVACNGDIPHDILINVDGTDGHRWARITNTRFKKALKNYKLSLNKKKKETEAAIEVAAANSTIVLKEDPSLPVAEKVKIRTVKDCIGKRVEICGWAHRVRRQSKKMMFIILRDGTGFLQCLLTKDLPQTAEGIALTQESTVRIKGVIAKVPEGQVAAGGVELQADYWELIGKAPGGGCEAIVTDESDVDWQLDQRHLVIRGANTSKIIKLTAIIAESFREHYSSRGFTEVLYKLTFVWVFRFIRLPWCKPKSRADQRYSNSTTLANPLSSPSRVSSTSKRVSQLLATATVWSEVIVPKR